MKKQGGPGKSHRKGISLLQLAQLFPDEESARRWFEAILWPNGRCCGHCGSTATREVPKRKPLDYWCKDCRNYFSVRTGTTLQDSKLPLQKWAFAVYLYVTHLKSVSSMKLHRDLGITQKSAWFMLHRLRRAWDASGIEPFEGPVEVDESFFGGRRRNMSNSKRRAIKGRGAVGKTAVIGAKDRKTNAVRAEVVKRTNTETLQDFVHKNVDTEAIVYTDDAAAYDGVVRWHESVCHSTGEYVRQQAHTNGIESFWAMLKRAHKGTFHRLSPKHLQRYVDEFAGRHNLRDLDTDMQMQTIVAGLVGRTLLYRDLIADNGLEAQART